MTLEQLLRQEGDFKVRSMINDDGQVSFYIHPLDRDGRTLDFVVQDNKLTEKYQT